MVSTSAVFRIVFLGQDWISMIPKSGHQPSVLGFLVENVIISHLAKEGLILDGHNLRKLAVLKLGADHLLDPDLQLKHPIFYIPIKE